LFIQHGTGGRRHGRQLPSVEEGGLMYLPLGGAGNVR